MLNHTYTSVNNANLVDCGKKQHISSQPSPLLKDNFLGEFRTELDKKKVLANLGIASDLVLEWKNIKGDIGQNKALMEALDARTKYSSELNPDIVTIADGIAYIESILGKDLDAESTQNTRLAALEETTTNLRTDLEAYKDTLSKDLTELNNYITNTVDVEFAALSERIKTIVSDLENINNLITVSDSDTNALKLKVDEHAGLYVENLSPRIDKLDETVGKLGTEVSDINKSLDTFVTIEQLGGDGEFDFVNQSDFSSFSTTVDQRLGNFEKELEKTVKTGEDGYVKNLFVDQISNNKENTDIIITDSFEMSSAKPLDVRSVVPDVSDLKNLDPTVCYAGMSVIAINQSAIYILKAPAEGSEITSDYLKNSDNWKCPEDLVTEIITRAKYEEYVKKGSLSSHIFYYIIEDVEAEPNPDLYVGGVDSEEYKAALDRWLKYLQGQYMSGVWGQEIEKVVAGKASITAVNSLSSQVTDLTKKVNSISGNVGNFNLEQVFNQVESHTQQIKDLTSDSKTLQQGITDLSNSVSTTYVTKQEITTEDPDAEYIFVKKSAFESYVQDHAEALKTGIETDVVKTPTLTFSEDMSLSAFNGKIQANGDDVALVKELPKIECKSKDEYDNLETKDINTYYYVYDESDRVVLDSEFSDYKQYQTNYLNNLSSSVTTNTNNIQILMARIEELSSELANLKTQINNSEIN